MPFIAYGFYFLFIEYFLIYFNKFGHLSTLKTLWLDDNNFENFPVCLCLLKNLTSLRFSSNKLTLENLPLSISQLTSLETLVINISVYHHHKINKTR